MRDAGRFQIEAVDRGFAPGGDQQMAAGDGLLGAGGFDRCRYGSASVRDADDIDAAADDDALALELIEHDHGAFRIVLGERCGLLQHSHRTPQAAEGLRHFQADRPGADDDEMLRPLGEIENRLVGEIRPLVESGDRRHRRRRSGRDHEPARANFDIADNERPAILECRGALDDAHAEPGEALGRIVGRNRGDHAMHVRVHLGEIDRGARRRHAEHAGALHQPRALGRRQQSLRRHAAGVEAVAAHLVLFDQHRRHAERGRGRGNRQAAGAAADHANVGCEYFRHCAQDLPQIFQQ